ncbi:protein FAM204A isoform X1 [Osmerus eperlanus]|uniref:protein FAM204A isoform X1 n=1 Tax=Osmerus eperlanus TaxID=29151 RepID=UPI002E118A26
MYRGLLPKGLTDLELSSDDEIDAASQEPQSKSKGLVGSLHNSEGEHGGAAVEKEPCTANVIENDPSPDCSLPGISQEMWQKFKELQKKKDELKTTKLYRKGKRQRKKKKVNKPGTESMESNQKREHQVEHEKHWGGLKQYFGINDRFQPPASGDLTPQSGLEKSIESAIAGGDFAKAEEMSDRLATREPQKEEPSPARRHSLTVPVIHEISCLWLCSDKNEQICTMYCSRNLIFILACRLKEISCLQA